MNCVAEFNKPGMVTLPRKPEHLFNLLCFGCVFHSHLTASTSSGAHHEGFHLLFLPHDTHTQGKYIFYFILFYSISTVEAAKLSYSGSRKLSRVEEQLEWCEVEKGSLNYLATSSNEWTNSQT